MFILWIAYYSVITFLQNLIHFILILGTCVQFALCPMGPYLSYFSHIDTIILLYIMESSTVYNNTVALPMS